jgi:N-acetylglucosamine kinase-like BadF-type ATPase
MMLTPITILIDGGGTSTDVAVVRSGQIIARTSLASFKPLREHDRTDDLCRALGAWLVSVDAAALQPSFMLIGMSGVWGPHEKQSYLNAFTDAWVTYVDHRVPRISILSDVELVVFAALRERPGAVIIAGTGSIVVARDAAGTIHRSGGWGPRIDDAGGGFWFGREALRAVARMIDGRGPDTLLIRPVAAFLRTDPLDVSAVSSALRSASVDRAARLAETVLTYADEGDAVAQDIRQRGAAELAECLNAVAPHITNTDAIVCYGSLFKNHSFFDLVRQHAHDRHITSPISVIDDILHSSLSQLAH